MRSERRCRSPEGRLLGLEQGGKLALTASWCCGEDAAVCCCAGWGPSCSCGACLTCCGGSGLVAGGFPTMADSQITWDASKRSSSCPSRI